MATKMTDKHIVEQHVLVPLTRKMHWRVRNSVTQRFDAMSRELEYKLEIQSTDLQLMRARKWTNLRLLTLFALNSFYQEFLAPLRASARNKASRLGAQHPIKHGALLFGTEHQAAVVKASSQFTTIMDQARFDYAWLTVATCGELIFKIARSIRDAEREDGHGDHDH